jgi:hypothetical protein
VSARKEVLRHRAESSSEVLHGPDVLSVMHVDLEAGQLLDQIGYHYRSELLVFTSLNGRSHRRSTDRTSLPRDEHVPRHPSHKVLSNDCSRRDEYPPLDR